MTHEKLMSHLKYILGERDDNVTSTDSVLLETQYESPEETTIPEQDTTTRRMVDVTSPAVYISKIKKLYASSTLKPQENSTGVIEEPGMYQDWRARLRKAIKYRLNKLHEDSESEKEQTK
ncbi:hypothetical protein WA026_019686 [Henosepilachna vigintioctopunctata]|uniref:Uncharacterized protein n=1 Tax=Henosepilachna vigintioctopunctata TaxID=420089 RepID=A0AAW1UNS9_9CUCU